MCPMYQINTSEGGELRLETKDLPSVRTTDAERMAERLRRQDEARRAERYAELAAHPTPEEGIVITEETRKRLEKEQKDKASVPNVVTTHSDVAKVASGDHGVGLVPTVDVYTKTNPLEQDNKVEVEDRTVFGGGIAPGGTVLDRAETSLRQPKGDEYSTKSATGPTLPEGAVLPAIEAGEETEPAHDPADSSADQLRQTADNADKVAAKADADARAASSAPAAGPTEDTEVRTNRGTGTDDTAATSTRAARTAPAKATKAAPAKKAAAKKSSSKK